MKGKFTIKAQANKERRGYADHFGYGVRYYIDYKLVNEQFYKPESDGSFSYEMDTTAFEDGEHVLHVGMCDHNDHTASASAKVRIDNSGL